MNPFAVSPLEAQTQLSTARANPLQPGDVGASWYEGIGTGLVTGPQSAYYRDLFRTAQAVKDEPLQQRALTSLGAVQPDPNTVGMAGQIAFQFAEVLSMAGISFLGGNPLPMLLAIDVTDTYQRSQTPLNVKAGMDPETAARVATTQAIGIGAGLVMPAAVPGGLATRAASGAGINLALGLGTRADISSTLREAGYPEMAAQYAPFQASAVLTDVALGAFFGGLLGPRPRAALPEIRPSDVDAALTGNNAAHVELGTAPGIPADAAARAAHVEALTRAMDDLINGRDVTVPEAVTTANFIEHPTAGATREAVRVAVEEHLGPEWATLQAELARRGLPTEPDLYSRGEAPGMTVEALTATVRQAVPEAAALVDNGRVQMVDSPAALPPRADGQAHPADARGYFDGERFYLVAQNLDETQVRGVMVHEVGAHYGMERLLGPDLYAKILQEVADRAKAGEADFAQAMRDVPMDTPEANIGKEALAYLVENRPDLPLIKRIFSELKTGLYRMLGGRFITLNADDLRTLAVAAVRRVSSAEMPGLRAEPVELYARAKPGVESPGVGVAAENLNGFEPDLRVAVPGRVTLPPKPLILTGTNAKNAARQINAIDDILARFPEADRDPLEWSRMMAYAMASKDVPIPPYRFLKDINSDGALRSLQRLTKGQIEDANHGFENARAFREAYVDGTMSVEDTGKLFMWSFLSRGVSPYTQEGLFIDAFPGIGPWIKKAADGQLTEADFPAYEAWSKSVAPQGSGQPGSGATHNLNAFGRLFLFKMGQRGEDGVSRLQKLHDLMADPNQTGPAIRRWFIENAEGVGIDNKVVSFTLLVAGFPDVMVLDRVQIRQLWDDGRFAGRNLYDGRKVDGKPVPGSMLSEITYGARGLLIYEAVERALAKRVENLYTLLGRPQDASIGRYHWETWVADSAQEASHGTLDAILAAAKGDAEAMAGVTAKEGEYGGYAYGARYGRDAGGTPYFQYTTPGGADLQFTVPAFREFLAAVKSPKNRVVPTGFKVTEAGNAPWFERPEVNKQALDELAKSYAAGSDGGAAAGEGALAVRETGPGEAIPDQPGGGAGAAFGPDYVVANNPALTIITADGRMVSAARALADADAEIASATRDSQGYEAAVACALRG